MLLQLLQRNADYYPDDTAIVYGNEVITHQVLLERVEKCAHGLLNLGVKPGDRIALFLENSPDFITSFFAVLACRGVNVPLNLEYKEDELLFYLEDARVGIIIVESVRVGLASQVAVNLPQDVQIVEVGSAKGDVIPFCDLLACTDETSLPSNKLDDDVIFIYSSGSTGRPKCVPRTVEQYWWEMDDVIQTTRLTRDDTIFCVIPLFHNFGAVQCMMTAAGSGAKLIIFKNPNPFVLKRNSVLQLLEKERASIFPCVPFMFDHLVETSKSANLSSIRLCYSAAAALSKETSDAFLDKFQIPIREHYGCTEIGAMTINLDDNPQLHSESVGRAFLGVNLRILNDDGKELPSSDIGEVVVSSRAMTSGYSGVNEQDKEIFRNGYFYTGDLGYLDTEKRLFLKGRKKFVIEVVGHKFSPMEVEDVMVEHSAVSDCIVIGIPSPSGNEEVVKAFVVQNGSCEKDDLVSFCRERMANFKVPQEITFISEVPKNTLGKIIRKRNVLEALVIEDIRI